MQVELSTDEIANIIVAIEIRLLTGGLGQSKDKERSQKLVDRLDKILKKEGK